MCSTGSRSNGMKIVFGLEIDQMPFVGFALELETDDALTPILFGDHNPPIKYFNATNPKTSQPFVPTTHECFKLEILGTTKSLMGINKINADPKASDYFGTKVKEGIIRRQTGVSGAGYFEEKYFVLSQKAGKWSLEWWPNEKTVGKGELTDLSKCTKLVKTKPKRPSHWADKKYKYQFELTVDGKVIKLRAPKGAAEERADWLTQLATPCGAVTEVTKQDDPWKFWKNLG